MAAFGITPGQNLATRAKAAVGAVVAPQSEYDRLLANGDTAGAAAYAAGQGNASKAAAAAGDFAARSAYNNPQAKNTTTGSAYNTTPGILSGPGAYENWLKTNKDSLSGPSNVQSLYGSGAANALNGSSISGVSGLSDPGGYQAWLNGTGAAGVQNGNSAGVLGTLGGPVGSINSGNSQGVLDSLTTGPTSQANVGASRDVLGSLTTGPRGEATGNKNASSVLGTLATGPSQSTSVYNQAKGVLTGPGAYEQFYKQYGNDPMQQGYTEALYESGIGKLDPYYDYAEKRSLEAAQRASAARGGFNSGLAAQQESDITSNLRGQQAKTWVDLAPIADAAKRARYQQGSDFANLSQQSLQGRWKDLSGIASAGDTADYQRASNRINAAGLADTSANASYKNFWDATNSAGANRVNAAGNVDRATIDAYNGFWNATNAAGQNRVSAAGNADEASINTYGAINKALNDSNQNRISAAGNADDAAYKAYTGQADAYGKGGDLAIGAQNSNIDLADRQDTTRRNNLESQFGMANMADASQLSRLGATAGMYQDLQSTGQGRIKDALSATSGQSQRDAQLAQDIYADMSSVNGLDSTALQAIAEKYGLSIQEAKDKIEALGGTIKGIINLGGALGGK